MTPFPLPPDPDLTRIPDEILVARVAQVGGDPAAFRALLNRYLAWVAPTLLLWGRRVRFSVEDFEDAIQEARLGLLAAVRSFPQRTEDQDGRFAPYAIAVFRNTLCKFIRSRKRYECRLDRAAPAFQVLAAPSSTALRPRPLPGRSPRGRDPLGRVLWRELKAHVRRVLAGMDDQARWIGEQVLAGAPRRTIAAGLGLTPGQTSYRIRRVLEYLQDHLAPWGW